MLVFLSALRRLARVLSLVLLAAVGSTILMRYAPGYFVDSREMDAAHATTARAQLNAMRAGEASLPALLQGQARRWMHGDLGTSRHYNLPVSVLLRERSSPTAHLLVRGLTLGWALALALALPLSARRSDQGEVFITGWTAALLAVPVGVLATVSLLLNQGGPVLVLGLLIAVRDFKLLYRLLRSSWRAPHLLQARAQGFDFTRMIRAHLLPVLGPELLTIAMMSLVVALSALVPVEVIFDTPGLGQLAWSAAINRDLPVLAAVTALLAACVGAAAMFTDPNRSAESTSCA